MNARSPLSIAALGVVLLAACTPATTQRAQRTYEHISQPTLLYVAMEGVLKGAGYDVAKVEAARREMETGWKEYDVAGRGRERRKYYAWYELGSLQDRYDVFLELNVQERPPGRDWTDRQVAQEQDPEYQRILQQFDAAVKKIGGIRY